MNEIVLTENDGIRITQMDALTANIPFYHVERVAAMYVMIYVLSGSIYVTEDGEDYDAGEGDMLLLKKGTHQQGRKLIREGTSWIYAHFQICAAERGDETAESEVVLPKHVNLTGYSEVGQRLKDLRAVYDSGRLMSRNRASLGLYELLLDIVEYVSASKTNSLITRIDSFISANLRKNISGEELANEFHITYKHLNRLYKNHCGRSIMQTYFSERMKAAAAELRTSNKPVGVISDEMGFTDPLYFSKCFRRYAGVSPRQYRQAAVSEF